MRWMEWLNELIRRLQTLFSRRERFDRDLEEEMSLHRDLRARELRHDGARPQDARYAAQRRFGNTLQLREEIHQAWGWTWIDHLSLDLRYATRRLRQSPGFTAVAALTLALGIGANTAIYSFMDALLLRSLPVPDPQSLVVLKWHVRTLDDSGPIGGRSVIHGRSGSTYDTPGLGLTGGIFPYPAFELLQKNSSPFSILFAYYPTRRLNVIVKSQAEIDKGEYVSGEYFHGLEVPPAAGRLISPDDDRVQAPAVAVASFGFSQRRFGSAANAVGQTILANSVPVTIVGVTSPEFFGVDPATSPDLYFAVHANLLLESSLHGGMMPATYLDQNDYWIEMMARLRPGVTMDQAQAALAPLFHQWVGSTATTDLERANLPALALQEGAGGLDRLRRRYSQPLYILLTLVGFILAIACANIANLLLARATGRRREMALRLSIGANRFRLVRQLLTESVLLAALGGTLGVVVAIWGIRFLTLLLANGQPGFALHAELNRHVLGMAAALSLVTGVVFGLAPALQSTGVDVVPALKEVHAGDARTRSPLSLSHVLVASQIGLSLLMLVAAGLFMRTLKNLQSVELGINRENLLLFQLNARQAGHRDPEIVSFYDTLQKRFAALPGIRSASLAHQALIADGESSDCLVVPGNPPDERTRFLNVGPAFFSTMQVPILMGREIDEHDQPGSPAVVVVNEVFARLYFGHENPLGHRLSFGCHSVARDMEIVGLTRNAHYGDLKNEIPPVIYVPDSQSPVRYDEMTYALRTAGDPLTYVKTVREIVHQADARVPVTDVRTQAAAIDRTMGQEIMFAKLCTAFAVLALVIACVGLYGTMSYNIARRTGEIGIRIALGAQRGAVVWMVLREVFLLTALGLGIGLPAAFATSRLVRYFLFNMRPNDPVALTLAVATLLGSALLAGYAPARRASRIDPMVALRHE
jgi:macrolide transport system ATP-binding/permease protein